MGQKENPHQENIEQLFVEQWAGVVLCFRVIFSFPTPMQQNIEAIYDNAKNYLS